MRMQADGQLDRATGMYYYNAGSVKNITSLALEVAPDLTPSLCLFSYSTFADAVSGAKPLSVLRRDPRPGYEALQVHVKQSAPAEILILVEYYPYTKAMLQSIQEGVVRNLLYVKPHFIEQYPELGYIRTHYLVRDCSSLDGALYPEKLLSRADAEQFIKSAGLVSGSSVGMLTEGLSRESCFNFLVHNLEFLTTPYVSGEPMLKLQKRYLPIEVGFEGLCTLYRQILTKSSSEYDLKRVMLWANRQRSRYYRSVTGQAIGNPKHELTPEQYAWKLHAERTNALHITNRDAVSPAWGGGGQYSPFDQVGIPVGECICPRYEVVKGIAETHAYTQGIFDAYYQAKASQFAGYIHLSEETLYPQSVSKCVYLSVINKLKTLEGISIEGVKQTSIHELELTGQGRMGHASQVDEGPQGFIAGTIGTLVSLPGALKEEMIAELKSSYGASRVESWLQAQKAVEGGRSGIIDPIQNNVKAIKDLGKAASPSPFQADADLDAGDEAAYRQAKTPIPLRTPLDLLQNAPKVVMGDSTIAATVGGASTYFPCLLYFIKTVSVVQKLKNDPKDPFVWNDLCEHLSSGFEKGVSIAGQFTSVAGIATYSAPILSVLGSLTMTIKTIKDTRDLRQKKREVEMLLSAVSIALEKVAVKGSYTLRVIYGEQISQELQQLLHQDVLDLKANVDFLLQRYDMQLQRKEVELVFDSFKLATTIICGALAFITAGVSLVAVQVVHGAMQGMMTVVQTGLRANRYAEKNLLYNIEYAKVQQELVSVNTPMTRRMCLERDQFLLQQAQMISGKSATQGKMGSFFSFGHSELQSQLKGLGGTIVSGATVDDYRRVKIGSFVVSAFVRHQYDQLLALENPAVKSYLLIAQGLGECIGFKNSMDENPVLRRLCNLPVYWNLYDYNSSRDVLDTAYWEALRQVANLVP